MTGQGQDVDKGGFDQGNIYYLLEALCAAGHRIEKT